MIGGDRNPTVARGLRIAKSSQLIPSGPTSCAPETQAIVSDIKRVSRAAEEASLTSTRRASASTELNAQAEDPNLWNDQQRAQRVMQERTALEDQLTSIGRIEQELDDQLTMIELGEAEKRSEGRRARPRRRCASSGPRSRGRELEALLSGEADANDSYLEVHAGAGGTESQDWASMLLRMYTRWAEQHGFKVEYHGGDRKARKPASSRRPSRSRAATPMAGSRPRAACIGWCASRRSIPTRAATPRLPASTSIR